MALVSQLLAPEIDRPTLAQVLDQNIYTCSHLLENSCKSRLCRHLRGAQEVGLGIVSSRSPTTSRTEASTWPFRKRPAPPPIGKPHRQHHE